MNTLGGDRARLAFLLPPMSYIMDDELVEVTPENIRLRKRWLDPNERKKRERKKESETA